MSEKPSPKKSSPALRRYVNVVIAFTILLIWWGAATTTEKAGMVFADWPLSLGSINPEGWLNNLAPFLEHIHRLTATLVGLLTLGLLIWVYGKTSIKHGIEIFGLVILLAVIFGIFIASGRERVEPDRKQFLLTVGALVSLLPILWLIFSWAKRNWTLLQKLASLALLMVTAQAIFGGLRVTEISDGWAVFHGCFAHAFFCVLILTALVASPGWLNNRPTIVEGTQRPLRRFSIMAIAIIVTQLGLGAYMRHHHRFGLADTGIIKTTGKLIPSFEDPMIMILFFHKVTAIGLFAFAIVFLLWLRKQVNADRRFLKYQTIVVTLLVGQITLGILVIAMGKSFWITNFHVLNGLAILAVAFSIMAWSVRAKNEVLIAADSR